MKKILCALVLAVGATSALACKCPEPRKKEPLVCKSHEEQHIDEKAQREQERQDRIKERQKKIKDALSDLVNIP